MPTPSTPSFGMAGAPSGAADLPPHLQLLLMTDGKRVSQIAYAIAELNVADLLAEAPRSAEELADLVGAHPGALARLLRASTGIGLLRQEESGAFTLTPIGEALRSDVPTSQRDMVLYNSDETLWNSYGAIMHTVRTGQPAFEKIYGSSYFEHLTAHPETGTLFDRAMSRMSAVSGWLLLNQYDFGSFERIVDVGGGSGRFLAQVLADHPGATGILADRRSVLDQAPQVLDEFGVADRVRLEPTDFFSSVPSPADAYFLKAVLHDWSDPDAVAILRTVRRAMDHSPGAKLLIMEQVLSPANQWDRGKMLDMDMMLRFGGAERDLREWTDLLAQAGFRITGEPTTGTWSVLECVPDDQEKDG